jgi:hypothetical protein
MKKLSILMVLLTLLLTLSACDAFVRDDYASVGETRSNGQMSLTLDSVTYGEASLGALDEDEVFIVLNFTMQNIGTVITRTINPETDFTLENGNTYSVDITIEGNDSLEGRIEVGERKEGTITFKVPEDFETLYLTFDNGMQADGIFIYKITKNDLSS